MIRQPEKELLNIDKNKVSQFITLVLNPFTINCTFSVSTVMHIHSFKKGMICWSCLYCCTIRQGLSWIKPISCMMHHINLTINYIAHNNALILCLGAFSTAPVSVLLLTEEQKGCCWNLIARAFWTLKEGHILPIRHFKLSKNSTLVVCAGFSNFNVQSVYLLESTYYIRHIYF